MRTHFVEEIGFGRKSIRIPKGFQGGYQKKSQEGFQNEIPKGFQEGFQRDSKEDSRKRFQEGFQRDSNPCSCPGARLVELYTVFSDPVELYTVFSTQKCGQKPDQNLAKNP